MKESEEPGRISRRDIIKWFAAAAAASQLAPFAALGQDKGVSAKGYGTDPKVAGIFKPGDFWELTLTSQQRKLVTALADAILPADDLGPAASALRVPDFIDEWVSAPYPRQQSSRKTILPGLKDFNELSRLQLGKDFVDLAASKRSELLDTLAGKEKKTALMKRAATFLHEFTGLCMGAYYGTPEGWKAIGYVGNMPLGSFPGPPQEVLDRVGVVQTVK